jgi:hypothetical protein
VVMEAAAGVLVRCSTMIGMARPRNTRIKSIRQAEEEVAARAEVARARPAERDRRSLILAMRARDLDRAAVTRSRRALAAAEMRRKRRDATESASLHPQRSEGVSFVETQARRFTLAGLIRTCGSGRAASCDLR